MFDIGWTELLVIGVVALIVVGPKDLPMMFRQLGRFTAKMKGMAREFQRAMDEAADESGVRDVHKDLKSMTSARSMGLDKLKDAADKFEKWEPGKSGVRAPKTGDAARAAARPAAPAMDEAPDEEAGDEAAIAADVAATPRPAATTAPAPAPAPAAAPAAAPRDGKAGDGGANDGGEGRA